MIEILIKIFVLYAAAEEKYIAYPKGKIMENNVMFECKKCGNRFLAHIDEYKNVF